jgi:hypothetical protein
MVTFETQCDWFNVIFTVTFIHIMHCFSVVDRKFEPQSGQTRDNKIGISLLLMQY